MAFYEQGKDGAVVPFTSELTEEQKQDLVAAIERADEGQIVAGLTGSPDAREVFLYSYPIETKDGKKDVIGISVEGAKQIALDLGNTEVLRDLKVENRDGYFYVAMWARDITRNTTLMGVGRQCQHILGKGNEPTDRLDELAFVKAVSKGQRNAILAIAPQLVLHRIVQSYMLLEKTQRLPPTSRAALPSPQPAAPKSTEPKPAKPAKDDAWKALGFASAAEQTSMRKQTIDILRGLNFDDNAIKGWLEKKGILASTKDLTKDRLVDLVKEATELKELAVAESDELP